MTNTFIDLSGNKWILKVNIKHYISFKEQGLVDLAKIFDDENFLSGLLNQADMLPFLGILHELCEDQYQKNGVADANEFYGGFDGDTMAAATEAFIGAAVAFLPAHRRDAMTEAYKTVRMGMETAGAEAAKSIADRRPSQLQQIEKKIREDM